MAVTAWSDRRLGRAELAWFDRWRDGRSETEWNFKLYRQTTPKIVGLTAETAAVLECRLEDADGTTPTAG